MTPTRLLTTSMSGAPRTGLCPQGQLRGRASETHTHAVWLQACPGVGVPISSRVSPSPGQPQASLLAVAWRHLLGQCMQCHRFQGRAGNGAPQGQTPLLPVVCGCFQAMAKLSPDRDPRACKLRNLYSGLSGKLVDPVGKGHLSPLCGAGLGRLYGRHIPPLAGTEAQSPSRLCHHLPSGEFLPSALGCLGTRT